MDHEWSRFGDVGLRIGPGRNAAECREMIAGGAIERVNQQWVINTQAGNHEYQ